MVLCRLVESTRTELDAFSWARVNGRSTRRRQTGSVR